MTIDNQDKELERADDIIGHDVSGLNSISKVKPKELEEILQEFDKEFGHARDCRIDSFFFAEGCDCRRGRYRDFLTQAYSIALQKGREEGIARKGNSGRLLFQDGYKAGREEERKRIRKLVESKIRLTRDLESTYRNLALSEIITSLEESK